MGVVGREGSGDNNNGDEVKAATRGRIKGRDQLDNSLTSTQRHVIIAHNRNLIEYFARLGMKNSNDQVRSFCFQSFFF